MRFVLVTAVLSLALTACPSTPRDGDDDGQEGEGEEGEGEEGEGEGEEGEGEGATPLLAACTANRECESGSCTGLFDGDLVNDFCTDACIDDNDCDFGPGTSSICVQQLGQCFATCDSTADCGGLDGDGTLGTCFINEGLGVNLCFSLNGSQFCEDGSECAADESCTLVGSGLKFEFICTPSEALDVGETCDATALARRGLPCRQATDCPADFACVDENGDNTGPRVCSASEPVNCGAFLCWDQGVCAGPCDADDDCPADWQCETFDFGAPELVQLCSPGHGSFTPCTSDDDCPSDEESCSLRNDEEGKSTTVCILPNDGDVLPGGACGDRFTTVDEIEPTAGCTSALCVNDGTCGIICAEDADCGGNACVRFELGNDEPENILGVCATGPRCDNDVDCGASGLCFRSQGPDGSVGICTVDVRGDLAAGAVCDEATNFNLAAGNVQCFDDAACVTAGGPGFVCDVANNSCVPPEADLCRGGCFFGRCLQTCDDDADCGGADFVCSGDEEIVDQNDPADDSDDEVDDFGTCVFLPGTRQACGSTADCGGGEVCNAYVLRDTLAVTTVCTSRTDGAALDAACGVIGVNFVGCDDVCAKDDAGPASHCRAVCETNSDCTAPLVCRAFDLDSVGAERSLNLCQPDDGDGGIVGEAG